MINFTPNEFIAIWAHIREHVNSNYNTGRGSKSAITGKDMIFMTMCVLKQGAKWDLMAYLFGIKPPTFEKRVTAMIRLLSGHCYNKFIAFYQNKYAMTRLQTDKHKLNKYKMCLYALDVTCQQSYRPGGSLEESKRYFSGKQKLYGYKTEVAVLPNGIAIHCPAHEPGSVADIEIFRRNLGFHLEAVEKSVEERAITYISNGVDEDPNHWAILFDEGNQGIQSDTRAVMSMKKPTGGVLTLEQRRENEKISGDRILVENYFG